jgi:alpha-beta hydrolase superfamily lysophospholipase
MGWTGRVARAGVTALAVALAVSGAADAAVQGAPGVKRGPAGNAFYNAPAKLVRGTHGSLIWARSIKAPAGAVAWKVLYRSQLADGSPTAVSGFVVAPKGAAPKGGRPVVAWAHGTEGIGRNCAPSLAPDPARDLVDYFTYGSPYQQDVGIPALTELVQAGYVVAATDYQGLGTPGTAQYAVSSAQAQNVYDSVLAAQRLKSAGAGDRVVTFGWSQGGGAAIWAGQVTGYAPSLKLLGVAALAPESDTGPQAADQVAPGPVTATSPFHAVAIRLNLYQGFAATYPELNVADVVTPAGMAAYKGAGVECVNHLAYVINTNVAAPADLEAWFPPTTPPDWQKRFDENTAGLVPNAAPQLVMQGTADTVINPNATAQYVQRACAFGRPLQFTTYDGATHQTIPLVAKSEYLSWIADRFAGKAPPSNC